MSLCRSVNPPLPAFGSSNDSGEAWNGRRLLSLVKTALQKRKQKTDEDVEENDDGVENGVESHPEADNTNDKAATVVAAAAHQAVDEAIAILESLIAMTSRRGLLQANVKLAERVLLSTSNANGSNGGRNPTNNNNNNSGGNSKRKRDKGRNNKNNSSLSSGLVIYADDFQQPGGGGPGGASIGAAATTTTSTTLDVNLILSAILRILGSGGTNGRTQQQSSSCSSSTTIISTNDVHLLVTMAADLCTAIAEFIIQTSQSSSSRNSVVVLAEYELLAASAKPILTALANCCGMNCLKQPDPVDRNDDDALLDEDEEEEQAIALKSCLRAAASLVSLFGTKLARSVGILQQLGQVAWQVIVVVAGPSLSWTGENSDDSAAGVVDAATRLLSALPLAGGLDRVTPSQLWNTSFHNCLQMQLQLLQAVVPVGQRLTSHMNTSSSSSRRLTDETLTSVLDNMLTNIASVPDNNGQQEQRVALFLRYIHALTRLACHYLQSRQQLALRQVSVLTVLDLVDILLSFPMAAEAAYHGTKKRLRHETVVHGGVLNITMIATHVANPLKLYGFQLLQALVNAMGGPLLLPFAPRLTRTSQAALLTSASTTVRSVLDPSSSAAVANTRNSNSNNKRRRWLNASIVVRTAGLQSLGHIVQTFGAIDVSKNKNNNNNVAASVRNIASETDRAIALVAACLVEQVQLATTQDEQQDEWGTVPERVELVIHAVKCLQAYLLSHSGGGAFLTMEARTLIESVTESGLIKLMDSSGGNSSGSSSPVLGFTAVQASILSLGTSCVCTPWPDGGASVLQGILCDAARTCQYRSSSHNNSELVEAATSALRLCESLANPRVPAIQIVTRQQQQQSMPAGGGGVGGGGSRMVTQVSDLASRLEQAHGESKRLADEETARDEARRNRQKEKGQSSKKTKTTTTEATPIAVTDTKASEQTTRTNNGSAVERDGQEQPASPTVAVKLSDSYQTKEDGKPRNLSSNKDNASDTATTTTRSTSKHQDKEDDTGDGGGEDDFPIIMNVGPDEDDM